MNSMKITENKKGFTLVEMLVVIAIIAVLVAILIPTLIGVTTKAKAATDAQNLRAVLAVMNIKLLDTNATEASAVAQSLTYECKMFPGAETWAVFYNETMVEIYYVYNDKFYSVDYFSQVAVNGDANDQTLNQYITNADALNAKGRLYKAGNNTDKDYNAAQNAE